MILTVIVACEIGFWAAIALGLVARYPLRRPRLGLIILASVPVIDLALLIATAVNLRSGATATGAHGLAAVYIGFSVAYGHRLIGWADVRFAHRYAGGPAPVRLDGMAYTRHCWGDVARTLFAAGLAGGLTAALIWWIDDELRTQALQENYGWLAVILGLDLLWAISTVLWPRTPQPGGSTHHGQAGPMSGSARAHTAQVSPSHD